MAGSLYCRPSDILAPTWSRVSGGATVSGYEPTYLGQFLPYSPRPYRAASGSVVWRATFAGATTVNGISLHGQHTLGGVAVGITSGAGLSTSLTPGADTHDGHATGAFKDTRGLSGIASTTFDFTISGASENLLLNKTVLWGEVRTMKSRWNLIEGRDHGIDYLETELDSPLVYDKRTRRRPWRTTVNLESERQAMYDLADSARGRGRFWPLVPDATAQECLLVRFVNTALLVERKSPYVSPMQIAVEEHGLGQAIP